MFPQNFQNKIRIHSLNSARDTGVQSQVESYQRLKKKKKKMVLDTALLNTQLYKVRIKGKVEQSREWSSALPYTSVAIEKGALGSPSTKVTDFTLLCIPQIKRVINLKPTSLVVV